MTDIIKELQDLRHLNWTKSRKSSGTAGSFLKSYDDSDIVKKYYKLSDYDPVRGIIGHECVNEIIVQRLLRLLEIEHLEYRLVHAVITLNDHEIETYLCESEDYKKKGETKIALEDYYALERKEGQTPLDFCIEKGWGEYVYQMLITDYLILNRDRHGANIEVLRSAKTKSIRLAPLFDHGLSLVCRCHTEDELKQFDTLEDKRVQAFIGSGSTLENLKLVPKKTIRALPGLSENDFDSLFDDLFEILGKEYCHKIHEMIRERWYTLGNL